VEKIKVMIVDDQIMFRKGLRMALSDIKGVELTEDAYDGKEFLDLIYKDMPDVVLMDIKMPVMNGIEATTIAMSLYPNLKIIVISVHDDEDSLIQMIEAGAKGFLLKDTSEDELLNAIHMVSNGKNYFAQELIPNLTIAYTKNKTFTSEKEEITEKLTRRETEILGYICKGFTNRELADLCFISPRTAGGHRTRLLEKTGCKNTAQLVAFGIKYNLAGREK
jgi:DNA-binding NarL/FixJ family response regulator